jgi:hypothetical protein
MGRARGEQTEACARQVQTICQTSPPAGLATSQPANANVNKTPLSFFFHFKNNNQAHRNNHCTQEPPPPPPQQWMSHVTTTWKRHTQQGQTNGNTTGLTLTTRLPQKPGNEVATTKDVGTGATAMNATTSWQYS